MLHAAFVKWGLKVRPVFPGHSQPAVEVMYCSPDSIAALCIDQEATILNCYLQWPT